MDIANALKSVSLNLNCPEVAERKTISIVCNLVARFNKVPTEDAYTLILGVVPSAIQAWKEGKAHNLSSALYVRGKFVLRTEVAKIKKMEVKEEKLNTVSLDASFEEGSNLHETIADPNSTSIDWQDAFKFILGNAGFTEREMKVFLGMRDGKTLEQIGEDFGVSRQAIHLSKVAIQQKVLKIKHKVV